MALLNSINPAPRKGRSKRSLSVRPAAESMAPLVEAAHFYIKRYGR